MSYKDLMAKRTEEVKAPKAMPVGTFTFLILRHEIGQSRKKKTDQVEFFVRPVSFEADVDEGEIKEVPNWQQREMRKTFYITENALHRLRDFFVTVLGPDAEGRSLEECLPMTTNRTFKAYVTQRPAEDGNIYNDIGDVAADE